MSISFRQLAASGRIFLASLALAAGLAGAANAQPQAPALETYLLTEDRLVAYILTAVDMAAEQIVLQQRYNIPIFQPDAMAAIVAAGGGPEAAAIVTRHGFADDAELNAFGQAVAQAQTFIAEPEYWTQVMGTQQPPARNVDLVRMYRAALATIGPGIVQLIEPDPTPYPDWATNPYPLTPEIVAAFAATQRLLNDPIQAILERNRIVPDTVDAAPVVAALAAAGALPEVNAIMAQYGYAGLEEWYGINVAIAQAYGWIVFAEAGAEGNFGLPPPPPANVMAVMPHFDAVAALGIYDFTLPE